MRLEHLIERERFGRGLLSQEKKMLSVYLWGPPCKGRSSIVAWLCLCLFEWF